MDYFNEPGELSLYDAVNGWLFLSFTPDFRIREKAKTVYNIERAKRRYDSVLTMTARTQKSAQATADALATREDTAQTVYFTGLASLGIVSDLDIVAEMDRRDGLKADLHTILISGTTNDRSKIKRLYNMLDGDGGFENDANSDGLADGWVGSGYDKIAASFLSGGGNAQQLEFGSAGQEIHRDVTAPFNDFRRVTFSAYFKADDQVNATPQTSYFRLAVYFLDASGATIDSYSKEISLANLAQAREQINIAYTPTQQVVTIRAAIEKSANGNAYILVDNAQLEFSRSAGTYSDQ